MKKRWHVLTVLFLSVLLLMPGGLIEADVTTYGKGTPSDPKGTPGTWYPGEIPVNLDPSKPPIVFVQGLNGSADNWYEETRYHGRNDMVDYAFNNGYHTAFVQLHDAGGEAASVRENGKMLAGLLKEIHDHFGEKVNVVAHSKGGPDTQAALVHYNAYPYVGRVVTLGSPHHGSHLADLAYSWWAGWLAELIGSKSPGTESLQVGKMEQFRSETDTHPNVNKNMYYTVAGTSWGPFPSALWTGGAYLSSHGENDGLVNEWSTKLPNGSHLFTDKLDHDNIRLGKKVFSRIEGTLRSTSTAGVTTQIKTEQPMDETWDVSGHILRGGPLQADKMVMEEIPVESGLKKAIFNVMTYGPTDVTLVSPSGKKYSKIQRGKDTQFFDGADVQAISINKPEPGAWTVKVKSSRKSAYLLTTALDGKDPVRLKWKGGKSKNKKVPVEVEMVQTDSKRKGQFDAKVKLISPLENGSATMEKGMYQSKLVREGDRFKGQLPLLQKSGVYNMTVDVKGINDKGEAFERTLVRSFYAE